MRMQAAKRLQAAIDSAAHKLPTADWQQNQEWLRVVEMGKHAKVSIVLIMIHILPLLACRLGHSVALLVSTALMIGDEFLFYQTEVLLMLHCRGLNQALASQRHRVTIVGGPGLRQKCMAEDSQSSLYSRVRSALSSDVQHL